MVHADIFSAVLSHSIGTIRQLERKAVIHRDDISPFCVRSNVIDVFSFQRHSKLARSVGYLYFHPGFSPGCAILVHQYVERCYGILHVNFLGDSELFIVCCIPVSVMLVCRSRTCGVGAVYSRERIRCIGSAVFARG